MSTLPRIIDPSQETPVFPILYTDGNQLPGVAGSEDEELPGFQVRMTLQRSTGVLVKTVFSSSAPGVTTWSFLWDAGDLIAGENQKMLLEYIAPGGETQSIGNFLLDVQARLT